MHSVDLVSVIIPVYNVEKYLDRCLKSVLEQDYQNIEIILVDDGSIDKSPQICDSWMASHPDKLHVIHQQNQGASIARKSGIAVAKGQYLTFVDSDDFVHSGYVSLLYRAAVENDTLVAVCGFYKSMVGEDYQPQGITSESKVLSKDELLERFFKYEFWGFGGGIYHKSLFDNLLYPTATINEDYFVKAQIFSKVDNVGYYPQPLYIYETHPGSLSNLKLSIKALGEFDNTIATWQFISQNEPNYEKHALAIASEATCKWLGVLNHNTSSENPIYENYKQMMKRFISCNFFQILLNNKLLWKIRLVLMWEYLKCMYR